MHNFYHEDGRRYRQNFGYGRPPHRGCGCGNNCFSYVIPGVGCEQERPEGGAGPERPQGEIGPQGPMGPQGEAGPQGSSSHLMSASRFFPLD